jgi:taurine transport system substrate-binding protein
MKKLIAAFAGVWMLAAPVSAQSQDMSIIVGVQPVMIVPLWNAYQQGLFEKAGLDVSFQVFTSGPAQTAALNSGVIDVAFGAATTFWTLASNGADLQWAVTLGDFNNADGLVVGPGSDINEVADLRGRSIALPFSTVVHGPLELLLRENGIPLDEVELVNLAPPQAAAAVLSGTVDAAFAWPPFIDEVVNRGGSLIVHASDTPGGGWSWTGFAVRNAFTEENPESIATFVRVLAQGIPNMEANREAIIDAVVTTVGMPRDAAVRQFDQVTFPPVEDNVAEDSPMSMCGASEGRGIGLTLNQAREFYSGTGQVANPMPFEDYLAIDVVRNAFGADCDV